MNESPFQTYPEWLASNTPADDVTVWRYRDFPQFVSILEYDSLWFSRLDQFKDPFEGTLTDVNDEMKRQTWESMSESDNPLQTAKEGRENWRKSKYLNCWHGREIESASMWDIYSRRGQAVAIKSTVGNMIDALSQGGGIRRNGTYHDINIGRVNYVDFENDKMPHYADAPVFYKRESFEHEAEIRIVLGYTEKDQAPNEEGVIRPDYSEQPPGLRVGIEKDELIDEIRVSPWADSWFVDLVQDVAGTYGLGDKVGPSNLKGDPNLIL